jgi:hypothetical protein
MTEFDKIYLSWRKGIGNVRFIVGVLEKTTTDSFVFQYDNEQVEQAGKEGFKPYTEFSDVQKFYDFWEIEPQFFNDKFYLLGHTQGLLPTDHFEFLADYNPVSHLHFLTDLARVEIQQHSSDRLAEGDELQVRLEKDNQHDSEAVAVYKNDLKIGYIKKVHCRVFHKEGGAKLKLKVKAVDKNGIIKKAFVKVYSDNN